MNRGAAAAVSSPLDSTRRLKPIRLPPDGLFFCVDAPCAAVTSIFVDGLRESARLVNLQEVG